MRTRVKILLIRSVQQSYIISWLLHFQMIRPNHWWNWSIRRVLYAPRQLSTSSYVQGIPLLGPYPYRRPTVPSAPKRCTQNIAFFVSSSVKKRSDGSSSEGPIPTKYFLPGKNKQKHPRSSCQMGRKTSMVDELLKVK